jgi:hypothetical protein
MGLTIDEAIENCLVEVQATKIEASSLIACI